MCPSTIATVQPLGIGALTRRCATWQGDSTTAAISFRLAIHPIRGRELCFSTLCHGLTRAGNRLARATWQQSIAGRLR